MPEGSPRLCGSCELSTLPPARKGPELLARKEREPRNLLEERSWICGFHGPRLGGAEVARSPLGCPCLYPVLPKKRSLELAQQPRLYKCLGMYAWQMFRLYSASGWAQAGQGVHALLGSHCAQTCWNSCHHLSCRSLQFSPMTETLPSGLPWLLPQCSPKGLANQHVREAIVLAQILTRSPATEASGISPGLIKTTRTLCFSDAPWGKKQVCCEDEN